MHPSTTHGRAEPSEAILVVPKAKTITGLERLITDPVELGRFAGLRVALLCNPTAVDRNFRHAVELLLAAGVNLKALFGPEHGIRGEAQDMIGVVDEPRDRKTGLPVFSLYGAEESSLSPTEESLRGIDAVVFDIQDVGSRYYTFVWTLILTMRVCARLGVKVFVLDRPNPIDGVTVEGGKIDPGFGSFVGLCSVPNRHGLTVGEIANWCNRGLVWGDVAEPPIGCDLHVVRMTNWDRSQSYDATGLAWVLPSPNMPTVDTAYVYPGMCLVEGTELSEARGATKPFELFGAPWLDPDRLCAALDELDLPGVAFRPAYFRPTFHKFAEQTVGGLQLHVTDRQTFRPYRTGVAILAAAYALDPMRFQFRAKPYEFIGDIPAIDLLTGNGDLRESINKGQSAATILAELERKIAPDELRFRSAAERQWLYPLASTVPPGEGR